MKYILPIICLLLFGCQTNRLPKASGNNQFVGNWISFNIEDPKDYGPNIGWEIEFHSDGSFIQISDDGFGVRRIKEGDYYFEDGTLFLGYSFRDKPWQTTFEFHEDFLRISAPPMLGWHLDLRRSDTHHEELAKLPDTPKSVAEAVLVLREILDQETMEAIRIAKEDDLFEYHFGLGQYIRNAFGLWGENRDLLKSCGSATMHPDTASSVIIDALWKDLQKQG